ncbi:hypothetical protein [Neobacillus bataviensis]|uniref:hypothetical protein n=1 Tax=Neobacillus bataviensis TaxID=220685 RepID=UPI001CBFFA34|nr:hypothetical protein [Neobacillus bataviensis]
MDSKFTKPKGFGEILDHTFNLCKKHFKEFFLILLILMGPVYLIQAILQLMSGTSFFRQVGTGSDWFEQMLSSFEESGTFESSSISADIGVIVIAIVSFLLFPVAEAAVLFAVNHIRNNEEFSSGLVIKEAFSRFWPMLGSSLLFGLITFGIILIPVAIIAGAGFGVSAIGHPIVGILTGVLLFFAFALVIGLLITRWSFYFASVILDRQSPGLSRSWRLTKKRTWPLFGLYIVFYLIISSISFAVQASLGLSLGNSVLLSIISNLITIITTMFFTVGYAVMYLDLKTRHDADDLKEMIEDYYLK